MGNDSLTSEDRIQDTKLRVDIRGHVLHMGLNRPEKRNAFDLDLYRQLSLAYGELHRNPNLRCGVLYAKGDHFTAGLELLLACDIRVAADTVRFGQIEIKRGIYPVGGATVRLFQEVGWGNAVRYLLTGDEITAKEAFRLGLVQEVTSVEACLERREARFKGV